MRLPSELPLRALVVSILVVVCSTDQISAQVQPVTPASGPGIRPETAPAVGEPNQLTPNDVNRGDHMQPLPLGGAQPFGPGCPTSPFSIPEPSDVEEVFSVDCGAGLDTGCTFSGGGPFVIQLPIGRYLGETNPDGTLKFPFTMNANHLISIKAKLRLPAFDVDFDANPPDAAPERDRVSINGHTLGFLTGSNNVWKLNEFTIPISYLKFPAAPGASGAPTPVMNEIVIDIDVANAEEVWCTAIDWVAVTIDAMAPIALVHGVNADHTSWDGDVVDFLDGLMIVHSNAVASIDNNPAGYIILNGKALTGFFNTLATRVGAKKIHVVAHSKGGLDTRLYLGWYYDPDQLKVLSLHTLSTPHHGSALATISVARIDHNDPTSNDERIRVYMNNDWLGSAVGVAPQEPALRDLSIESMALLNRTMSLPGGTRYYAHAADADVNGDTLISNAECAGMIPGAVNSLLNTGSLLYQILCCVDGVTVTRMTNFFGLNEWHVVSPVPSTVFHLNDLAVTRESAQYPGFTFEGTHNLNHSTIKGAGPLQTVVNRIQSDYPIKNTPN